MAWYPGATKIELQPESDAQPAIRPTQFIVHSLAAPWTAVQTSRYWRDSTNLESHFGLGYQGDLAQYIGTQTRADANAAANLRPDGTGAVSIETASNAGATDKWTDAQIDKLVALGVWLHHQHGIPLRICRTQSDPGYGYHRLFDAWNPDSHSCPGDARVRQFRDVVFPRIVARATGTTNEEDDMALTTADAKTVWNADFVKAPVEDPANPTWAPSSYLRDTNLRTRDVQQKLAGLEPVALTDAQLDTLAGKVAAHPALAEQIAEQVAEKIAARLAE